MKLNTLILSLFLAFSFLGCRSYSQDEYQEYYVVESFLVGEAPLPKLYLSRTQESSQFYDFEDLVVPNATVTLDVLEGDENSDSDSTITMSFNGINAYEADFEHQVISDKNYKLTITIPNETEPIIGYTSIPASFTNANPVPNSLEYQSEDQIEINIPASQNSTRQNYFIFSTIFQGEATIENLTPTFREIFEESEDDDSDINEFVKSSSGIISEGNFDTEPDGSLTLRFPWIGITFFGNNTIVTNIIDENMYDFIRSQEVQLGGGSISPGEIPNAIYNLEGAIGVFGSMATDTLNINITRRPQDIN